MKNRLSFIAIAISWLLLGCSPTNSTERVVGFKDYYATQQEFSPNIKFRDLQTVKGKKILLFPIFAEAELKLKPELLTQLSQSFEKQLKAYSIFNVQGQKDFKPLQDQPQQAIFLDSYYTASTADKNISTQFKKELGIDLLLFPQIFTVPCSTCPFISQGVQIKVALVDTQTGFMVWSSYNSQKEVSQNQLSAVLRQLLKESALLMYNRYREHWFEQRARSLQKLAG